jgi:hypothetical protein
LSACAACLTERSDVIARLDSLELDLREQSTTTEKNFRMVFETLRRLLDDGADTNAGRIDFRLHETAEGYSANQRALRRRGDNLYSNSRAKRKSR